MKEIYYTVDQVSEIIGMHPKTIRRFIREGKLKASKVGKQYRITGHDLSLFTEGDGHDSHFEIHSNNESTIKISSVIEIEKMNEEGSNRISNMLMASMNHKDPDCGHATLQAKYLPSEKKLRLMIWGSLKFTQAILGDIEMLVSHD